MEHKIIDGEFVVCELCQKKLQKIDNRHLKRKHDVTFEEYRTKFPEAPTITTVQQEKDLETKRKREETRKNGPQEVIKNCWNYKNCGNKVLVNINVGKIKVTCEDCKRKGLYHPDVLKEREKKAERFSKMNQDRNVINKRTEKLRNRSPEEIEEFRRKRAETLEKKLGPNWKTILANHTRESLLRTYGEDVYDMINEKREQTYYEKTGFKNAMENPDVIIRIKSNGNKKRKIMTETKTNQDTSIDNSEEVQTYDYVLCPYCKQRMTTLQYTHLRKHNKTTEDVKREFPGYPMRCLRLQELSKKGGQSSKQTYNKMKKINCIHCGTEMEVRNNKSNKQACQSCLDKGLENPDGRTKDTANQRRTETLQDRYGKDVTNISHIDGVIEKRGQTNDELYGGTGFGSEITGGKARVTIKDVYGGDGNIMHTEEGKKQFTGSNNPLSKENPDSIEARKKISQAITGKPSKLKGKTYEKIHGEEKATVLKGNRSEHFKQKFLPSLEKALDYFELELLDSEYQGAHIKHKWRCKKCSTIFIQIWNSIQQGFQCPTCYPRFTGSSKFEREIANFIKDLGLSIEENNRSIIKPKELDIFIPSKKIAIECNGLYMHNEERVGKTYHLDKTNACKKLNIRLIHIFEDEWVYKNEIVKERLKYILGCSSAIKINGRDCEIKEIPNNLKDDFLEKYHIQGTDIGSPIRLGAYFNEELISVMTFTPLNISKGSKPKDNYWELSRFCSNYSYIVHGIAGKLISYFKQNYSWKEIITYADRRWSEGRLYIKLGFENRGHTSVDYWYSNGGLERISRFKMRKRPDEPKDTPEYILRAKDGYFRVYGCGHLKFRLRN